MSKRSQRREADRAARKQAYQQLRQHQSEAPQEPQPEPQPELTGRAASARNATKHGCCADDTLILKSESIEDYKALEATWFQAYKPKSDAEKHLVQELVNADWFQQRATRTLANAEARIMNEVENPLDWTEQHHRTIARFQRYLTTRANNFNRIRRALEDYLAKRAGEVIKHERHQVFKEKNKPEPSIRELLDDMRATKADRDRQDQQI